MVGIGSFNASVFCAGAGLNCICLAWSKALAGHCPGDGPARLAGPGLEGNCVVLGAVEVRPCPRDNGLKHRHSQWVKGWNKV